jgi:hypothetical protein
MAEDGGLFSGLKFSDIWFPAAASIASMYNPHIGRGLQTGMNLFNSFQDFQNSARYYKQLKEQQEREDAGIASARAGIEKEIGLIQGDISGLPAGSLRGDPRFQKPLLDESETSKFTLFGEEGPRLADPGQFSLHMRNMAGLQQEEPPNQQLELGIESLANPRFSEIDTESIALNSEVEGERKALNKLLRQQELALSLLPAAAGVASQASAQAGYVPLDAAYRDEARRKDLLAAFEEQQRAFELGELERQAEIQAVRTKQQIYDASTQKEQDWSWRYAEKFNLPKDKDAPLSYSQERALKAGAYRAYSDWQDPNKTEEAQEAGLQEALAAATEMKDRGIVLPKYLQDILDQYEALITGETIPTTPPPGGTVPSHTPGQYPGTTPTVNTQPRKKQPEVSEGAVATGASWFGPT